MKLGGDLEVGELIGRGGSAAVYRARDLVLGRTVAVKILHAAFGSDAGDLLAEARVQAALGSHANVLSVYGHGETDDGCPYIVLEDATGGSLRDRVESRGPLSVGESLRLLEELLAALAYAHSLGTVHCDVKPSNVLLSADGSVRLSDFGTALTSATETLEFLEGSLAFAPPEILEGRRPSWANDIYGLGVTVWFALAGTVPFGGLSQPAASLIARIHSDELSFGDFGLPEHVQALLERCVCKDPTRRSEASVCSAALQRSSVQIARSGESGAESENDELRRVLQKSIQDRRAVIERIFRDIESDLPAVEKVRRLLQDIATDSARAMKPLVDIASRQCAALGGRQATLEQLRRLVIGDVTLMLAGHPSVIFDGGEPGVLSGPEQMQAIGRLVSEANRWAAGLCPDVDVDMNPLRQERGWVLLGSLANPAFLDDFFGDPRSADVFDPETLSILLATGRGFFENLVKGRGEWMFGSLLAREDVRRMVAFDHPHLVLMLLHEEPELVACVDDHLRNEIQLGLSRMTVSERAGIRSIYDDVLNTIGVSV